jgi:two-component system osmolarity sensor histidine kinase EnvZ
MRSPFNTLFGRMAILSVVVLAVVHAGWFALTLYQRPRQEADGFARGILLTLDVVSDRVIGGPQVAPVPKIRLVARRDGPNPATWPAPRGRLSQLQSVLRARLPAHTEVLIDDRKPAFLWVLFPNKDAWIVAPLDLPPLPFARESIGILIAAMVLSVFAAWQLQKPVSQIAQAARRFGRGERPPPVRSRGPYELRSLAATFNEMMKRLNEAEKDQAVMLAGVAHDLKAPLTRLRLRADVLATPAERGGFVRDIDSLSHIVQQFLEFADWHAAAGPSVGVDAFLCEQFASESDGETESRVDPQPDLFELSLRAGDGFKLPRTLIDRLVTNLVDNALDHGAPPVEIATVRDGDEWVVTVRDHGDGIAAADLDAAVKPFVRLDPARGGEGHCGLGLAIVCRLAQQHGGRCELRNAASGGLHVTIRLPAEPAPGRPSASETRAL